MRGLGRLLALPLLLIALAAQSLAPAEAAAMQPDMAALGICSAAHELGGSHRPDPSPAGSHDHDCCAFACALAGLAAAPPAHAVAVRIAFAEPAQWRRSLAQDGISAAGRIIQAAWYRPRMRAPR